MNFSKVCRTCLRTESLNPIFNDEDDHDIYSSAVYLATGVQVLINDNLPQNMCSDCVKTINSTLKFRKQCKSVETELLHIQSVIKITSDLDIEENITLLHSYDVRKPALINNIDCIPTIELNTVLDVNIESKLKTEEFEHDIDIRKDSLIASENALTNSLYTDNVTEADDNEIKNTEQSTFIRILNKKAKFNKISLDETQNTVTDTFFNDNDINLSDNDTKTDIKQLNSTKKAIKKTNIRRISLDETERGISISIYDINESNTNDNDIKTDEDTITTKKFKIKRKTTKRVDLKTLADNTEYLPYKKSKDTKNEMVENEKIVDLPYNVLPGGKFDKITRVVCKMCAKELSIRSIDSHVSRCHPGADERKVKCELCDKHVMKEKLNRHNIMMHGSSYRCGYCKSEFEGRLLLVEHVKKCTAKKRRASKSGREMTECDECHQKMQKASLRMHKATKHAGLRPVCEHCGKSFGNKLRLREHCRAKHGYEKLKCSYCEFTSASVVAMRNHERRHRGEKPFVCESCGARFHAAYLLAQHRHSHRDRRALACDQCPATFKAANSLHAHKATCHSARAFACGLCARAYRCRHYALKHLRHVHRHRGPAPPLLLTPAIAATH